MKLALMLAPLVVALLAGCSGSDDAEPVTPKQDAEGRYVIELVAGNRFSPAEFAVPVGATLVFVNKAPAPHDVQGRGPASFTSGSAGGLSQGEEFEVVVEHMGAYDVWCQAHHSQGMVASMHVGHADDHPAEDHEHDEHNVTA